MHLSFLLLCLALGGWVNCAAGNEWCYTGCEHTPAHWGSISGSHCEGDRQSPIDIVTSSVETDHDLLDFTFINFTSRNVIKSIINNGHTAKCILAENEVEVSGGGLNGTYSAIQFHFHWGDTEHHPGSEHTIDGHRYPMEMHIVSLKKGLTVQQATEDSAGIAVLGFFINGTEDGMSEPWETLTTYLTDNKDTEVDMNATISIDDLIGNVNLTKFFRYMGSLTTPNCNEAVVWTVFQEPININKDLIQQFPGKTGLINVYRPTQDLNDRQVYASPATDLPPSHWCYDDHCDYGPSKWNLLPQSQCDKQHQSPINIDTNNVVMDEHLDDFTFEKFDDKHAIRYITNTGHTVKCVLKEGVVEISGGGLEHVYSTLQFHFHWGSTSDNSEGSEHTVDSHRYPMEMHIVNKRKDLTLDEAVKHPDGLAVLGFFIEAADMTKSNSGSESPETNPTSNPTSDVDVWKKLTNYLSSIQNISSEIEVTEEISIDDLIGDVNRAAYYRYKGSLTTPSCNEAVVWTVFKESIKVDKNMIMMFPTQTGYHDVFRPAQPVNSRTIYTTASASSAPAPILLPLLLAFLCAFFTQSHL
uniref:carbonic anhydrase 4-like n=1 Tax=Scatophagus argus TaxID=75038 RepID=UPI001ED8463E|nr:carbonic anhydrase 4-like [Scatophagus argus]XP_046232576.1 carbonic anhydrase 4-like [Scatophagus argus]